MAKSTFEPTTFCLSFGLALKMVENRLAYANSNDTHGIGFDSEYKLLSWSGQSYAALSRGGFQLHYLLPCNWSFCHYFH